MIPIPRKQSVPPLQAVGKDDASNKAAKYVNEFLAKAKEVLKDDAPANFILARGFAKHEPLPTMEERYGIKCAAVAQYPMYRGLARLVGMDVLPRPETYDAMFQQLADHYDDYDFFFVHFKKTDSYGEDGNFDAKVGVIEEVDTWVKKLDELNPDVLLITGDHSTPAVMSAHSWHPVPALLHTRNGLNRNDHTDQFGETQCGQGGLGRMVMKNIMLGSFGCSRKDYEVWGIKDFCPRIPRIINCILCDLSVLASLREIKLTQIIKV